MHSKHGYFFLPQFLKRCNIILKLLLEIVETPVPRQVHTMTQDIQYQSKQPACVDFICQQIEHYEQVNINIPYSTP